MLEKLAKPDTGPTQRPGNFETPESRTPFIRPRVSGKFLFVGNDKFWIRGATYGTFRPDDNGCDYPTPAIVDADFKAMAENGLNAIRVYTVPPRWLLDAAENHRLRVMVGLPWEQHVAFLTRPRAAAEIIDRLRMDVDRCRGHPAILSYAIGNEIPSQIVRWHGAPRVERFLRSLADMVRRADPGALVTYVNYPTTEYLDLSFVDFLSFNVYLESNETLAAYLARLQNIAGERPLVMAEIGLDSRRNGEDRQAGALNSQIRTCFDAGCSGAIIFAWTDEWHRGGHDIVDWDFGLTTRDRAAKPALAAVRNAFVDAPFGGHATWPRVSVVVCSYNGARTIRDTLDGCVRLAYPDFEVIVVDDGSRDDTAKIAAEYDVRLISTANGGLSAARNIGMQAATGEIVAYIDDDAYPDSDWLHFLVRGFRCPDRAGVGGPNLAPPGDGPLADCVANAPGGPVHVLISDVEADHIPGCNMAFRKDRLEEIGGFDPRFRAAGDDVDICWRLRDRGWSLGFSAGAMNWHHRRNSLRHYWRQQVGYGKAEAMLEEKWPARYNTAGHVSWSGRLYGNGLTQALGGWRRRIYHGTWGGAPFQSLYRPAPNAWLSLPLMPEWWLVTAFLGVLCLIGLSWSPLLAIALPLFLAACAAAVIQALVSAAKAKFQTKPLPLGARIRLSAITAGLHLVQPVARLTGRLRHGLTPWRRRGAVMFGHPWRQDIALWSENWRASETILTTLLRVLRDQAAIARCGGDFDGWDIEVRGGLLGAARVTMAVEEHGGGRQLIRLRIAPRVSPIISMLVPGFLVLAVTAGSGGSWTAAAALALLGVGAAAWAVADGMAAAGRSKQAIEQLEGRRI